MTDMNQSILCDNADLFAAVHVAHDMVESLSWKYREQARDELERLMTSGEGARMEWQDGIMVGYASDAFLDFMADVEELLDVRP